MPKKLSSSHSLSKKAPVISVIGLGYVGLPLAIALSSKFTVIGFDVSAERIRQLKAGSDVNNEFLKNDLQRRALSFENNVKAISKANFHIVTVPTPVDNAQQPDLSFVKQASHTIGGILKKGDIVVYESTVYPGVTEDECVPILSKASGLKYNADFFVGYSPERINPGDKKNTFETIKKVVSASSPEALERVAAVYSAVVKAGIHKAPSIKTAEAAKVIENTQRDINVALMNECAMLFDKLGIDTQDVLAAARTKWNFLPFVPGLVGGHCIGVDPYYLTYKAATVGYHPQVILSGRRINDNMGAFIAERTVKELIQTKQCILGATVTVLGVTFKENCKDIRNSKVFDVIRALQSYGIDVQVHDPVADAKDVKNECGITLKPWNRLKTANAVVIAVPHDAYRQLSEKEIIKLLAPSSAVIDVKALFKPEAFKKHNIRYWRL
jgi:UDP-N-acetyl-D-galactosamine dehydrogenase